MKLQIYTDGSCIGNPGPGGWAALLRTPVEEHRIQGGALHTTNNRMELGAVIEALKFTREKLPAAEEIEIYSDSSWVVNTMTQNWKRKKNLDLWDELMPLVEGKNISWNWVRGHAGHAENEDCDTRAQNEARKQAELAEGMDTKGLNFPGDNLSLF